MRQIVLDTETTGLDAKSGHRLIEIGCVELINRRLTGNNFHYYLQPDRAIDFGAQKVHGITAEFLENKPRFSEIVNEFLEYIAEAELIIHNAPFDLSFLNAELKRNKSVCKSIESRCRVIDTLVMARERYPGQKNSLDALCKRHQIDSSKRILHGALLDAEILSELYLSMTGEQFHLSLDSDEEKKEIVSVDISFNSILLNKEENVGKIIYPNRIELNEHEAYMDRLKKINNKIPLWCELDVELS